MIHGPKQYKVPFPPSCSVWLSTVSVLVWRHPKSVLPQIWNDILRNCKTIVLFDVFSQVMAT